MNEKQCFELLGLERWGNPDTEMTIGSLSTAIVQSIDFRLTHTTERIEEFKVCLLSSGYSLLLKREDELLFLTVEEGYLEVSENGKHLFGSLSAEGRLRDVADDAVVTELERLRAQVVANQLLDAERKELAERDRLIEKYGMPLKVVNTVDGGLDLPLRIDRDGLNNIGTDRPYEKRSVFVE